MRIPAVLEQYSVPPLEFMSRAGLSPNLFLQGACWLPRDYCLGLANYAANMTDKPFFGAQVGGAIELQDLESFGKRIVDAANLGEALLTARDSLGMIHRGAILHEELTPRHLIMHFNFVGDLRVDPVHFEQGTLAVLRTISMLAGQPDGMRIQLTSPYSRKAGILEAFLGDRLEFGKSSNAILVDRELLEIPISGRKDNYMQPDIASIVQTAHLIMDMLPEGSATLENVAIRMRINERTLQRKLAKFGVTFENLVDTTRKDEAFKLLSEGRESLADIAFQLGYSSQSNFNRAFHRWTGNTPTAYRGKVN